MKNNMYSLRLVNFRTVCLLAVARKVRIIRTSNFSVSLTSFFIKKPLWGEGDHN